jgi:hypothetical protein
MKILYKFCSRSRPTKFFACLDNIRSLAKHDDYEILCSFDLDDNSMSNPEVRDRLKLYPKVKPYWGTSENKVHAINRDMEFSGDWDVLIVTADDFWFEVDGFDLEILKAAQENPDCLLHFPDGHANERLITMPIMDRAYFDRTGYIYYPGYRSVCPDNEQMEVSKILGRHRFFNKRLFTHRHPANGKQYGPADELLKKTEDPINYKIDGALLKERRKRNFDLIIP